MLDDVGTTVDNLHVRVDADFPDAAQRVAAEVTGPAFVTPPSHGWVTVYPEEGRLDRDQLAVGLSRRLGLPCISFLCFDSDVAIGSLVVAGEPVDQLVISVPGYLEEMMGEAPSGEPVPGVQSDFQVFADLGLWFSNLGLGTLEDVTAAASSDPKDPFADQVAAAVFECFGVPRSRLLMSYRFYADGEQPEEFATFIRTE